MSKLAFFNHKLNSLIYIAIAFISIYFYFWLVFDQILVTGKVTNWLYLIIFIAMVLMSLSAIFIFLRRIISSEPNFWLDKSGIHKEKNLFSNGAKVNWQEVNSIGLLHYKQINSFFWIPIFPIKWTNLTINSQNKQIKINLMGINRSNQEVLREIRDFCEINNLKINFLEDSEEVKRVNMV